MCWVGIFFLLGQRSQPPFTLLALQENERAFQRWWLRPRILRNVALADPSCSFLGDGCAFPVFLCPTSVVKTADPAGELGNVRAASRERVIYMCPTLGSYSLEEMGTASSFALWLQLYTTTDRERSAQLLKRAEAVGVKAIFVTVDTPVLGKRERDLRVKSAGVPLDGKTVKKSATGVAASIGFRHHAELDWAEIEWLQSMTTIPICLKGVAAGEDAVLAARRGIRAIVVSNHGARQLDCGRATLDSLIECVAALKSAGLYDRISVFVDGGIRRGSDIVKALALGAHGCGIGRPVLWSLAAYGEEGVVRMLQILKDEFLKCMMMCGVTQVSMLSKENLLWAPGAAL